MCEAGGWHEADVGPFVRAHGATSWSPIMAHRMVVVDLLVAVEAGLSKRSDYRLVNTWHEYRRVARQGSQTPQPETSDQVALPESAETRIVPDAAFVLENIATGGRGLYFLELDRGTERLARGSPEGYSATDKFVLYERYLTGGRFAETYRTSGDFRFFTLLFATTTAARINNLRQATARLTAKLHSYFKLATFEDAKRDPFAAIWRSRAPDDHRPTSIIKSNQ